MTSLQVARSSAAHLRALSAVDATPLQWASRHCLEGLVLLSILEKLQVCHTGRGLVVVGLDFNLFWESKKVFCLVYAKIDILCHAKPQGVLEQNAPPHWGQNSVS